MRLSKHGHSSLAKRILLAALLVFGCTSAFAQTREYVELVTPEMIVISDLSERSTRKIAAEITSFRAVVKHLMPEIDERAKVPLRIYVLSPRDWVRYSGRYHRFAGFFRLRPFRADIVINGESAEAAYDTVLHEYAHFVISNMGSHLPRWYDEGLAEFLSTTQFHNNFVRIGESPYRRMFSEQKKARSWIPLRQLLQTRWDDPNYQHGTSHEFYAQSWALTHYSIFENPRGLTTFLGDLRAGNSIEAAFQKGFGVTIEEFEARLKHYLARSAHKVQDISRSALPSAEPKVVSIRVLNTSSSTIELADLALDDGNTEFANELYLNVLNREPNHPIARAGHALATASLTSLAKAEEVMSTALTLGPKDYQVLIKAAALKQQQLEALAADDDRKPLFREQRDLLLRALESHTTDLEVVFRYANAVAIVGGNQREVAQYMKLALQVYPTHELLGLMYSNLCLDLGDLNSALAGWRRVATTAREPRYREAATRAIEYYQRFSPEASNRAAPSTE